MLSPQLSNKYSTGQKRNHPWTFAIYTPTSSKFQQRLPKQEIPNAETTYGWMWKRWFPFVQYLHQSYWLGLSSKQHTALEVWLSLLLYVHLLCEGVDCSKESILSIFDGNRVEISELTYQFLCVHLKNELYRWCCRSADSHRSWSLRTSSRRHLVEG